MAKSAYRIDLYLSDIRNFFQVPEVDPFAGEDIDLSGIDQLMDALRAKWDWRKRRLHAVVHLPPAAREDPRTADLKALLVRYCDVQILYCRRKIAEQRIDGGHALRMGTFFLALCLGLSATFEHLIGSDYLAGQILVEGLLIAGWVGLWHPLDLLLYAWWPYARDIKLYEKIRTMGLEVAFDRDSAARGPQGSPLARVASQGEGI